MNKSIVCWMWNDPKELARETPAPAAPPKPKDEHLSYDLRRLLAKQARITARAGLNDRVAAGRRQRIEAALRDRPKAAVAAPRIKFPRLFEPEYVNVMQRMFARHLPEKHRFICISDSKEGLSSDVEWMETPPEAKKLASLQSPEGERFPSCYRRLWTFSEDARALGDWVMCLDIDLVVVADMTPTFSLGADFVGWRPYRDWGRKLRFGGGQFLLRTGTRTEVWDRFKGVESIMEARAAGFRGSDQAWLSYVLADSRNEAYWPTNSGLYSVRDLGPALDHPLELPKDARLVQFNGYAKPWHYAAGLAGPVPWVVEHWR